MASGKATVTVTIAVLTVERLAGALQRIGPSEIEDMAFTPTVRPAEYVGDPDENVLVEEPYPMASLAAAIMRELER